MHLPPHISGNPNCCCFFSRPANSILRQLTEVPQPDQVYFLVSKTLKYTKSQIHKYKNTKIQKYFYSLGQLSWPRFLNMTHLKIQLFIQ